MAVLSLSWRLLRRDARAGELRLLAAALIVAVGAITAVGFFADRVRLGLEREAHQLLGADLLLVADHPWRDEVRAAARQRGLALAETLTFPSMVTSGEADGGRAQLADIKAVSAGYPLRGQLRTAPAVNEPDAAVAGVPAAGTVWIDERLAGALAARVGDAVTVGRLRLRVGAVLTFEPDRGVNFFSLAPRLMMNLADLPATGLVQVGSRIGYRLLLAGGEPELRSFRGWLEPRLGRGERIEDAQNARPEVRSALDRARSFLGLSALLTVVLAAVAVALAARRYVERHLDPCAVMRCLGASQAMLLRLHLAQFVVLGLAAALLGCGLGFAAHFVLHAWLASLLATPLPAPTALPALQGLAVGLLLLFGFAVPPLLRLKTVPTLRVLRRELDGARGGLLGGYGIGLACLLGLMFWMAGEVRLGGWVAGGFLGAMLLFAGAARGLVRLAQPFRTHVARGGFGWRHGLAGLERRAGAAVVQIVALALGFMALILLTVTRGELLDAWHRAVPADAPNRFVINIQPEQVEPVRRFFAAEGLTPELAPMVRGRLVRVNGQDVNEARFEEERAKRLIEREFNLSWRAGLPPGNVVTAGRWFEPADRGRGVASVEEGLARTLGLRVGDVLEFLIAGEPLKVQVVGLRRLDWDSMRVNFFVLMPPGVLDRFPASRITSFHLPPGREAIVDRLVQEFPNLTVVDVAAILRQLQSVLDQVARAVQFVFLFTVAAGLIVLHAALVSAFDERRRELAVMRALGARRRQVRQALLAEFASIGAAAGLIAALGAMAVGEVLARRVFQLEIGFSVWLPPLAAIGGAALVTAAGWLGARRLLQTPPVEALRAAD